MNCSGGHARPRQQVLPSFSTRTLQHPSFLPLYMAAGFAHHHIGCNDQAVHPIIPVEVFYTDPAMSCGRRIPNIVTDLGVLDCFQLNTPPPVMSACLAPPNRPDPFRSGPHPTRDLGCPRWRTNPIHSPVQPNRAVLQLTQEEDQAITNLLKLHHHGPRQSDQTLTATQMDFFSVAGPPVNLNPCLFPRRGWSDTELEAADTLLSRFSLMEEDRIWEQCHQKSAVTRLDPPTYQHDMDLPINTDTRQESEALPTLKAPLSQSDISYIGFTCASENTEPVWGDSRSVEDRGATGYFSEVGERMLSDLEGDAVHVLLSLGDMGTPDILQ
ncbi:uncharacterized protein LOC130164494 isoform X1 [Seriola aureovittata]|uniref:uncharacterized protein LOC130164494 isoform X1 n=1 Tax=Seriola aureovittata TaxID=2871759 RepID=UPI0024BE760A|nr:uncharacterized protein LOC130164494 isoform X1 [Seriola aureovittata]